MALQLVDFNNLSKTLTCCIYIMRYTSTERDKEEFVKYIKQMFSALKIQNFVEKVANIIGAAILYVTKYDYDPYGASVNMLTSDSQLNNSNMCAHLDKSHISVHTYPDINEVSHIRIDLEVSTCGNISPLKALSSIVEYFKPDILFFDFWIRGVTRNIEGKRVYTCEKYKEIIKRFCESKLSEYEVNFDLRDTNNGVLVKMLRRKGMATGNHVGKTILDMSDIVYKEAKEIFEER